jgi:hypothetical protein
MRSVRKSEKPRAVRTKRPPRERIHKTKLKRPNETLGLAPLLVDIGDLEPLLGSDRGAQIGQGHGIFRKSDTVRARDRDRCREDSSPVSSHPRVLADRCSKPLKSSVAGCMSPDRN